MRGAGTGISVGGGFTGGGVGVLGAGLGSKLGMGATVPSAQAAPFLMDAVEPAMPEDIHLALLTEGHNPHFAPYSSVETPIDFLPLTDAKQSQLQVAAERFAGTIPLDRTWVSTRERYRALVQSQLGVRDEGIVGEPDHHYATKALATLMYRMAQQDPSAIAVVVPTMQFISSGNLFLRQVHEAAASARQGEFVAFAVQPSRSVILENTVVRGPALDETGRLFSASQFVARPQHQTEARFTGDRRLHWSSGLFVWKAASFLQLIKEHLPDMFQRLGAIYDSVPTGRPLTPAELKRFHEGPRPERGYRDLLEMAAQRNKMVMAPLMAPWSPYEEGAIQYPKATTWQRLHSLGDVEELLQHRLLETPNPSARVLDLLGFGR